MEARPQVQGVFELRFAVGVGFVALSPHRTAALLPVAAGALAWWCAVVSAYLLNGVTDVAEDRANGSRRPIARGDLPVRLAGAVTLSLAAAALLLAGVGGRTAWWVAGFLALGWAYSAPPVAAKRWSLPCAAVVFGLGWTGYAAGAAAAGDGLTRGGMVFATAMSAWMALVGATLKDLTDVGGDAVGGRRTLATVRGPGAARLAGALGAALVGIGGPIAAAVWSPTVLAGTLPLTAGAVWVVRECVRFGRNGRQDRYARRAAYRAFMTTQYAANASMLGALLIGAVAR